VLPLELRVVAKHRLELQELQVLEKLPLVELEASFVVADSEPVVDKDLHKLFADTAFAAEEPFVPVEHNPYVDSHYMDCALVDVEESTDVEHANAEFEHTEWQQLDSKIVEFFEEPHR
jgi:hypothetical protein